MNEEDLNNMAHKSELVTVGPEGASVAPAQPYITNASEIALQGRVRFYDQIIANNSHGIMEEGPLELPFALMDYLRVAERHMRDAELALADMGIFRYSQSKSPNKVNKGGYING